jgi:3-oxoadipate enol-lactonase
MEECAACLVQILDEIAVKGCVLLGNSWGGMMGGVFAAKYPDRVRAAVLMNCTTSPAPLRQRLEFFALTSVLRTTGRVPETLVDRAVAAFVGPTTERDRRGVVEFIRSAVRRVDARSVRWAVESVVSRRRDQRALMGAITSPVLVLAGQEDRTFPVAETRAMAKAIPGARFQVLPRVGHLAAVEAPKIVSDAVDCPVVTPPWRGQRSGGPW